MDKDLVLVFGNFNILHPGHLRLLRYAKSISKRLVVGLFSDRLAGDAIFVSEDLRLEAILANSWVDDAFIVDSSVEEVIKQYEPCAVVKGKEYENQINSEEEIIKSYGGKLIFSSGDVSFSSADLLRKEYFKISNFPIEKHSGFMSRHNIKTENLIKLIEKFTTKNICVLGDVIVDRYTTCEPLGMSQEDPTLVVKPLSSTSYLGGAGIVALHGEALGAKVNLITVVGDDQEKDFIKKELKGRTKTDLFVDFSRPTTTKERFRAKNKTLLRVSNLSESSIGSDIQEKAIKKFKNLVKDLDLIIFSDFNYGFLTQHLVEEVIKLAKKNNVMMVADSQSSSQIGNISRYKDMNLITATEREARIGVRDNQIGLVKLAEETQRLSNCHYLFIKLAEEGVFLHVKDIESDKKYITDRLSSLNKSPVDTSGAGDSMLISSSLALISGASIWEAAYLGSLSSAIQVSRLGNIPITKSNLLELIRSQDK